jgi:hypothetical protein
MPNTNADSINIDYDALTTTVDPSVIDNQPTAPMSPNTTQVLLDSHNNISTITLQGIASGLITTIHQ